MGDHAFLGPLDPQVPSKDGRYVPAQALLTLLKMIQEDGDRALASKRNPQWSHIQLLHQMDQKQLGAAISASGYVTTMAAQYLEKYKFQSWTTHASSGATVTDEEKSVRAREVAETLCSHERWKAHGHAISRDVLRSEVRMQVDHPSADLQRAMRRLWALLYYTFDKANVVKLLLSHQTSYLRQQLALTIGATP